MIVIDWKNLFVVVVVDGVFDCVLDDCVCWVVLVLIVVVCECG